MKNKNLILCWVLVLTSISLGTAAYAQDPREKFNQTDSSSLSPTLNPPKATADSLKTATPPPAPEVKAPTVTKTSAVTKDNPSRTSVNAVPNAPTVNADKATVTKDNKSRTGSNPIPKDVPVNAVTNPPKVEPKVEAEKPVKPPVPTVAVDDPNKKKEETKAVGDHSVVGNPPPKVTTPEVKAIVGIPKPKEQRQEGINETDPLMAAFDPTKPCEDQALQRLYETMSANDVNVLGLMFELTAMKLALRALKDMDHAPKTLEQLTKSQIAGLKKKLADDKSQATADKVTKFYADYAKEGDLKKLQGSIDALSEEKNVCYWKPKQRLTNENSSALILAMNITEKGTENDVGLSDSDAAAVYVVEKLRDAKDKTDNVGNTKYPAVNVSKYQIGGDKDHMLGNELNISTRVVRYLGKIQGGTDTNADDLKALIEKTTKRLSDGMDKAYASVKDLLHSCIMQATKNCDSCTKDRMAAFAPNDKLNTDDIQKKMLSMIAKSDSASLETDLKGKLKNVASFDLSTMLSEGDVKPFQKTKKDFDPCWTKDGVKKSTATKSKKATNRSPGSPTNNFQFNSQFNQIGIGHDWNLNAPPPSFWDYKPSLWMPAKK